MILALDPTMSAIGAALFDNKGTLIGLSCIKPDKDAVDHGKSLSMGKQLNDLIVKHNVTDIVAEVTHGYIRNIDAARSIYKAEGLVQGIAGLHDLKYHSIGIYESKFFATGRKKGVTKKDMINAALMLKPKPPLSRKKNGEIHEGKSEHEADAIFIGMVWFAKMRLIAMTRL